MQYNPPFGQAGDAGYVNGNLSAGQAGSIPPAEALEFTQREIVACIQAAGLTPSNTDLRQLMQAVRGGALSFFGDVGIANTLIVNPNPTYLAYFTGMTLTVLPAFGNTGAATINVNQLGPKSIVKKGGTALTGGEWQAGDVIELKYNGTAFQIVGGGSISGGANLLLKAFYTPGAFTYIVPSGVSAILVQLWGAGGAGGSAGSSSASGSGGGGGGFTSDILKVTSGQVLNGIIGAGGPRPAANGANGTAGGTSTFASILSATGGSGGTGISYGYGIGATPGGMGYGSTSNFNIPGGLGRSGFLIGSNTYGGDGGQSWGSGDVSITQGGQHDGQAPGQGGAGAGGAVGGNQGSAGANGYCTIQSVG